MAVLRSEIRNPTASASAIRSRTRLGSPPEVVTNTHLENLMPRPELGKVALDDELLVIEKQYNGSDKVPIKACVIKAGPVWIEMIELYQVRSMARTWRMRRDNQSESANPSPYTTRFATSEQHTWDRVEAADAYLEQVKMTPNPASHWHTPERRLILANLLRTHEGLPGL